MKIQWIKQEKSNSAVTIYNNNITLSKQACGYFSDAYGIQVGFDTENEQLIMKKVTKEEAIKNNFDSSNLYTLTVKQSFGRINSKSLISELQKFIDVDFSKQTSFKFSAKYNTGEKMLIIDTKEVSKNV